MLTTNRKNPTQRRFRQAELKHGADVRKSLKEDESEEKKAARKHTQSQISLVDRWFLGKSQAEIDKKIAEVLVAVHSQENMKLAAEKGVQTLATPDLEALFAYIRAKGKKLRPEKLATQSDNKRWQYGEYILRDAFDMTGQISTLYKGKFHLIFIP